VDCSFKRPPEHPQPKILPKETSSSLENKLNDYFRRRCSNYERFLCDRVWECALCARQAGKVMPVEIELSYENDDDEQSTQEVKRSKWKE
jgi:hypothetical protein